MSGERVFPVSLLMSSWGKIRCFDSERLADRKTVFHDHRRGYSLRPRGDSFQVSRVVPVIALPFTVPLIVPIGIPNGPEGWLYTVRCGTRNGINSDSLIRRSLKDEGSPAHGASIMASRRDDVCQRPINCVMVPWCSVYRPEDFTSTLSPCKADARSLTSPHAR
jgi:hypothetical protein